MVLGCLPHQATLARRAVFDRTGPFDLRWRRHADYDWWLKVRMMGRCREPGRRKPLQSAYGLPDARAHPSSFDTHPSSGECLSVASPSCDLSRNAEKPLRSFWLSAITS